MNNQTNNKEINKSCDHRCSYCIEQGYNYCSVCRDEVEGTCPKKKYFRENWEDRFDEKYSYLTDTDMSGFGINMVEEIKLFISELLKSQEHKCSCNDFPTFYAEVEKRVREELVKKIEGIEVFSECAMNIKDYFLSLIKEDK